MLNKTPLLHQSSGPRVFLSLSFSLSGYFFGVQRPSEFTFLPGLLRPSWEGALRLHPIERVPEASVNRPSPMSGTILVFCINQGISASFSSLLSYRRLWTTRFWSIKGPQQSRVMTQSSWRKTWRVLLTGVGTGLSIQEHMTLGKSFKVELHGLHCVP